MCHDLVILTTYFSPALVINNVSSVAPYGFVEVSLSMPYASSNERFLFLESVHKHALYMANTGSIGIKESRLRLIVAFPDSAGSHKGYKSTGVRLWIKTN